MNEDEQTEADQRLLLEWIHVGADFRPRLRWKFIQHRNGKYLWRNQYGGTHVRDSNEFWSVR